MGTSTDAILAYGYNLGGDEEGWNLEEAGKYGELVLPWYSNQEDRDDDRDGEDEFVELAQAKLRAAAGFTETDYQVEGFWERKRAADAVHGVEFVSHCSSDYPMWVLATKEIVAHRGSPKVLDLLALNAEAKTSDWYKKLTAACAVLGITPKSKPGWILVSNWG